ncbi:MAG: Dna2/Cas4 domain-containing protein [Candidatus Thermoplasmatota archaeon]|jgi:CRISPR-associated exonuclease Cas4|nr:Dna2/Cas4 domain-containing protein [Candidatus Thermoplasmatota archaeon]
MSRKTYRNIDILRKKHKILEGKIVYSDLKALAKPLFSRRYMLTGKPDYVVRRDKYYIPVEVKTGVYDEPQRSHVFQLAAYCQLLEDAYGGFVPYGVLVYGDSHQYKIPFNPRIRFELDSTVKTMRYIMRTGNVVRNHDDVRRCIGCSMRTYCEIKML